MVSKKLNMTEPMQCKSIYWDTVARVQAACHRDVPLWHLWDYSWNAVSCFGSPNTTETRANWSESYRAPPRGYGAVSHDVQGEKKVVGYAQPQKEKNHVWDSLAVLHKQKGGYGQKQAFLRSAMKGQGWSQPESREILVWSKENIISYESS